MISSNYLWIFFKVAGLLYGSGGNRIYATKRKNIFIYFGNRLKNDFGFINSFVRAK